MAPMTISCPEHQIESDGICVCELGYSAFKKDNSLECRKCLECSPSLCLARNEVCNNNEPYDYGVDLKCIEPAPNYYSHPDSGDLTPCRLPCAPDEREMQTCSCDHDRKCECEKGIYKGGPHGDCSLVCGTCYSADQKRVPDGKCLDVPTYQRCVPVLETSTTITKAQDHLYKTTTPLVTPVKPTTALNQFDKTKSITVSNTHDLSQIVSFIVVITVALAFTGVYLLWKKFNLVKICEVVRGTTSNNGNAISTGNVVPLLGKDNTAVNEDEQEATNRADVDSNGDVDSDGDGDLDLIDERILQCQCVDWDRFFLDHVAGVMNSRHDKDRIRTEFVYNVFEEEYASDKLMYIKSFKCVINCLKTKRHNSFTTKDLITELKRIDGCHEAVRLICQHCKKNDSRYPGTPG